MNGCSMCTWFDDRLESLAAVEADTGQTFVVRQEARKLIQLLVHTMNKHKNYFHPKPLEALPW